MPEKYAVVVVRVEPGLRPGDLIAKCYPDGAQLFYASGPSLVRWVFQNVPAEIDKAEISFFATQPTDKYKNPATKPVLGKDALGLKVGELESSSGSHLPDLVTTANNKQDGYFFYQVLLTRQGALVVQTDPGGTNDPNWPPTSFPP